MQWICSYCFNKKKLKKNTPHKYGSKLLTVNCFFFIFSTWKSSMNSFYKYLSPDISYQLDYVVTMPKSQHILKQHRIQSWVSPKCLLQLKSYDTYFLCSSVLHTHDLLVSMQAAFSPPWLAHSSNAPNLKKKKSLFSRRETNSTKYGVTYGLRPLSRLSPLTVRCVFYVM